MMNIILIQCTYSFQAVEAQLDFIRGKWYITPFQKHYFYHCKNQEKPRVHWIGPTQILVVNIGSTTIHFGLEINTETKVVVLNEKSRATLRSMLSVVRFLIIGELYMVPIDLWTGMDPRLRWIFMMIDGKEFADFSVMTTTETLQLTTSSQRKTYIFTIYW